MKEEDDVMSRCRCSDITNTENQITQLENAQTILSGYAGRKENRDNNLSRCSSSAQQATGSGKVAAYHTTMTTLGNDMDAASSSISGKINARLGNLRSSLSSMRSEDHDYHEEERRRAEEAAREAAEAAAAAAALAAQRANL